MRRACIDIGSNTTRLLVAECANGGLVEIHQERVFTAIGQSLNDEREITPQKLQEVAVVVAAQLARARRLHAAEVRCVATAGVRRAANGMQLVKLIKETCPDLEVEVLSGEDEARLAFIGAAWAFPQASGALAVIDVGGGSTELVVGEPPARLSWCRSVPLGSGDLVRDGAMSDPPSALELAGVQQRVDQAFAGLQPPAADAVVAVGGSATSLTRMIGADLDAGALRRCLEVLTSAPAAVLGERYEIDARRMHLLPAGLLILQHVAQLFTVPIVVVGGGIRKGLLLDR